MIFFLNIDVSRSKFERVVELLKCTENIIIVFSEWHFMHF